MDILLDTTRSHFARDMWLFLVVGVVTKFVATSHGGRRMLHHRYISTGYKWTVSIPVNWHLRIGTSRGLDVSIMCAFLMHDLVSLTSCHKFEESPILS
jgi:hypothetical protein